MHGTAQLPIVTRQYLYKQQPGGVRGGGNDDTGGESQIDSFRSRPLGAGAGGAQTVSPEQMKEWRSFLFRCGVHTGVTMVPTRAPPTSSEDLKVAAGLKCRTSNKAVPLPYDLGVISKKTMAVVDTDLSPPWKRVLDFIEKADRRDRSNASTSGGMDRMGAKAVAKSFMTVLVMTSIDSTEGGTEKVKDVKALAASFKGEPAGASSAAGSAGGSGGVGSGGGSKAPSLSRAVPARRRLFYLPPGQAGASVCDMGTAAWVHRLSKAAWVVAVDPLARTTTTEAIGGGAVGDGYGSSRPLRLFPPPEVLMQLSTDNPDVPLIEVRPGVAARLNKGPLPALLGFGTAVTSASPMQRLDRLRDASRRNPASVTSTY